MPGIPSVPWGQTQIDSLACRRERCERVVDESAKDPRTKYRSKKHIFPQTENSSKQTIARLNFYARTNRVTGISFRATEFSSPDGELWLHQRDCFARVLSSRMFRITRFCGHFHYNVLLFIRRKVRANRRARIYSHQRPFGPTVRSSDVNLISRGIGQ